MFIFGLLVSMAAFAGAAELNMIPKVGKHKCRRVPGLRRRDLYFSRRDWSGWLNPLSNRRNPDHCFGSHRCLYDDLRAQHVGFTLYAGLIVNQKRPPYGGRPLSVS
jgi:hypothetical protein